MQSMSVMRQTTAVRTSLSARHAQGESLLCTNPDLPSHDFGNVQQGQTRTWTFDITNCGGGTLGWAVSDAQSWITVSPESVSATTEADTVTVTIDTSGLSDGAHSETITIGSNDGTKTETICVYVRTPPAPPISVPAFTPIGMLVTVCLFGIAAISSIRKR
jgi:hypothetical protein